MKRQVFWLAASAVLWLSACSTVPHPKVNPAVRQAAAVNTRWIGMTRPLRKSCPVPATVSWTVRPLVPVDKLRRDLQASVRKAGLDRYCLYDYHGQDLHPELPQDVLRQLRPGAGPDRAAMAASAESLGDKVWSPFYQHFLRGVQMPQAVSLPAGTQPSVRLAFLDSQPTGEDVHSEPGNSPHGYALANIAGQLVGGTQGGQALSSVHISSQLALPVVKFDPSRGTEVRDETHGGFRGTYADLAKAIVGAIAGWQPQGDQKHLVLNLSVGWDGEQFGGWEKRTANMPPEVRAVYDALKVAADQGVLVVAAAGNEVSGPNPTKRPLLPGGWETRGLVYAVSGVDGQDHPLVNTREKGEAPRVAYADHVTVPDIHDSEKHTPTLTGTSVASAVVSTTAALVWSYRPELSPAGVMQLLSDAAEPVNPPRKPDFATHVLPRGVRRVALCRSLQKACDMGHCPVPACSDEGKLADTSLEEKLRDFETDDSIACTSAVASGWRQFPNLLAQPWISTQPGADPCPNCVVSGPPDHAALRMLPAASSRVASLAVVSRQDLSPPETVGSGTSQVLRIDIDQWAAGKLSDATLELFGFDHKGRKRFLTAYALDKSFPQGYTLVVTSPLSGEGGTDIQARLRFTIDPPDGSPPVAPLTVDSPLYVDR